MNKCINCGVKVEFQHEKCPLCGRNLDVAKKENKTSYPDYSGVYKEEKSITAKKILMFITIVACFTVSFINIFATNGGVIWSVIVIASLLFSWGIFRSIASKNITLGGKLLYIYFLVSALVLTIDLCSGFNKWSTTYVIPFLTVLLTLVIAILSGSKKNKFNEYFGYILATFFVSIFPILFFVFSISNEVWTSLIAIVFCVVTILGLYIFSDKKFKMEIKKRFHI